MAPLKCVVVGGSSVGKTCLVRRYVEGEYKVLKESTIIDNYVASLPVSGKTYQLSIFDTSGIAQYRIFREEAYPNTNILLVCFAVDLGWSYADIQEWWIPELKRLCPGVPYILVGTRIDLRNDQKTIEKLAAKGNSFISKAEGEELAQKIGAIKYLECSALTKENVGDVFGEAAVAALSASRKGNNNRWCCISGESSP